VFYHTKLAHITYVTFPWLIAMPALTDIMTATANHRMLFTNSTAACTYNVINKKQSFQFNTH